MNRHLVIILLAGMLLIPAVSRAATTISGDITLDHSDSSDYAYSGTTNTLTVDLDQATAFSDRPGYNVIAINSLTGTGKISFINGTTEDRLVLRQ